VEVGKAGKTLAVVLVLAADFLWRVAATAADLVPGQAGLRLLVVIGE
jgi:hypothetical protein